MLPALLVFWCVSKDFKPYFTGEIQSKFSVLLLHDGPCIRQHKRVVPISLNKNKDGISSLWITVLTFIHTDGSFDCSIKINVINKYLLFHKHELLPLFCFTFKSIFLLFSKMPRWKPNDIELSAQAYNHRFKNGKYILWSDGEHFVNMVRSRHDAWRSLRTIICLLQYCVLVFLFVCRKPGFSSKKLTKITVIAGHGSGSQMTNTHIKRKFQPTQHGMCHFHIKHVTKANKTGWGSCI